MRCKVFFGVLDKSYIEALIQYLIESEKNQFEITYEYKMDSLENHMKDQSHDMYLLDETVLHSLTSAWVEMMKDKIILVAEDMIEQGGFLVCLLFKYQRAVEIEAFIANRFMKTTHLESINKRNMTTKIIGCFAPCGGSGNTTMAQMVAQSLKNKENTVLLISMEAYASYHLIYDHIQKRNLSDYMVHLMTHKNWMMGLIKMRSIDHTTGIHYMKPAISEVDMVDFEHELWMEWLDYMEHNSEYDYMVIDLRRESMPETMDYLKRCYHRVYTVRGDLIGHHKWRRFNEALARHKEELLLNHSTVFINKVLPSPLTEPVEHDGILDFEPALMAYAKDGAWTLNTQTNAYKTVEGLLGCV